MPTKEELRDLRLLGAMEMDAERAGHRKSIVDAFEAKLVTVTTMLEKRLRAAARMQYLELKLIAVDEPELVNLEKVCCVDIRRRDTRGGSWATVDPYQDKSVVRNAALLELWNTLESMSLRPIFIEGSYGKPIFGVQLPDGGKYPRDDTAREVANRTMNRMDEYLNEDGTFTLTPVPTIFSRGA